MFTNPLSLVGTHLGFHLFALTTEDKDDRAFIRLADFHLRPVLVEDAANALAHSRAPQLFDGKV
jgi:hypothetical protein